jgi:glutamine synthetase
MSQADLDAHGVQRLPRHLLEAVEILDGDGLAREVMGETMHSAFIRYKINEWERYHQTVTDWEVEEYLRLY